MSVAYASAPVACNARLHPGELPGLGVELDEELAAKYEYKRAYLPVNRLEDGSMWSIVWVTFKTGAGLIAFACAAQNWAFRRNTLVERSLFVIAGLLLVFPGLFEWMFTALAGVSIPQPGLIGLAIAIAAVFMQKFGPSAPTASAQH